LSRFVADFNRRFTVEPSESGSAFVPLIGVNLDLLLSVHHQRVVQNDSTVRLDGKKLQLPPTRTRAHYVRCPVIVHEFPGGAMGVSYQGEVLARYDSQGALLQAPVSRPRRPPVRQKATVALRAPSAFPQTGNRPPKTSNHSQTPTGHL
jgi:hypothetical protein